MPYKEKIIGIYLITVKGNVDYLYIGHSVNCKQRWKQHQSKLKLFKHSNPIMQNLYNKYGLCKFSFEIIEKDIPKENLHIVEQKYIDAIPINQRINIAKADRRVMSHAIKEAISIGRKKAFKEGKIDLSKALKARREFDKNRNKLEVYEWKHNKTSHVFVASIEQMSKYLDTEVSLLRKAIRKYRSPSCKNKTIYGYIINGSVKE